VRGGTRCTVGRVLEGLPQGVHRRREMRELFQVQLAQGIEALGALVGEAKPYDAEVVGVGAANEQSGRLSTIHETNRAVGTKQEVCGHVAHCWAAAVGVTAHGQQELVLSGRQTRGFGLLLAPVQEPPETGPQLQQPTVVLIGGYGRHRVGLSRLSRHPRRMSILGHNRL
jgi:hypothetical protein